MNKKQIQEYAKRAKRIEKDGFLIKICTGKSVLDVGCIGQDRDYSFSNWLHNKIRVVANSIDGVDILVDEVNKLNKAGYAMFSVEELQVLNKKYEIVLISDVIEHVNDPVSFVSFYSQFLTHGGKLIVSTPNSNRSINFVNILFNNNYSVNPEHVFWFCPKTFSEVAQRANLIIEEFFWIDNYFTNNQIRGMYQKFKIALSNFLFRLRPNFSPNMLFVLIKE